MKAFAASIVLSAICILVPLPVHADPSSQVPQPDAKAVATARAEIDELYAKELAKAKTAADKSALARDLLRTASETDDDPAAQFALMHLARELAIQATDRRRAMETVEAVVLRFTAADPADPKTWIKRGDEAMERAAKLADLDKLPGVRVVHDRTKGNECLAIQLEAAEWYLRAKQAGKGLLRRVAEKRLESIFTSTPPKSHAAAEKGSTVRRTLTVGGNGGTKFEDRLGIVPLVGFNVTFFDYSGHLVIGSIQPIYRTNHSTIVSKTYGNPNGKVVSMQAKAGYAVGGIVAKGGDLFDGFKVVFMRLHAGQLDKNQSYESEWVGNREGFAASAESIKAQGTYLGCDGKLVIGIFGGSGFAVDSIGLLQTE